jgi:hypothetical protein
LLGIKEILYEAFSFRVFLNLGGGGGAFSASDGVEVFYALIISGSGLNKNPSLHSYRNEILRLVIEIVFVLF